MTGLTEAIGVVVRHQLRAVGGTILLSVLQQHARGGTQRQGVRRNRCRDMHLEAAGVHETP